jgi:hypothetical protein
MLYAAEISPATSSFPQPPPNKPGEAMQKFLPPPSRSSQRKLKQLPNLSKRPEGSLFLSYQTAA